MAIEFSSLPSNVQNRINEIQKITVISKILAHDYPSGEVEYTVLGKDSFGHVFCKIFSEVMA
ncbi:MAG: hypothetical protein IJ220_05065 [Clostridia bacterium]|nr:hypothetical protein [Clostridia bacterium]